MTKEELLRFCQREFQALREMLKELEGLKETPEPTVLHKAAAGALIYTSYSGMERVIEKVLLYDTIVVQEHSPRRHTLLLEKAFQLGILPEGLFQNLRGFLAFREVFARTYVAELTWANLLALAERLQSTVQELQKEVRQYIETV
jgi:hypothetical protein